MRKIGRLLFMAWFFFKSGMTSKIRSILDEGIKCLHRLIIPYLIINLICLLIWCFWHFPISGWEGVIDIVKQLFYNECLPLCYPLWFLLSLALVRLVYISILFLRINKIIILIVGLLLGKLMNVYSYEDNLLLNTNYIPFWVGNVFLGLFFYCLGDLLKNKQYSNVYFYISIIVYIIHLFFPSYLDFNYNKSDFYILSVIYATAGIIVYNNIFKRWLNIKIPLLTHIGQNSMIYYITHGTFFYLIFVVNTFENTGWFLFILTTLLTIVFLYAMKLFFCLKSFKWLIGG